MIQMRVPDRNEYYTGQVGALERNLDDLPMMHFFMGQPPNLVLPPDIGKVPEFTGDAIGELYLPEHPSGVLYPQYRFDYYYDMNDASGANVSEAYTGLATPIQTTSSGLPLIRCILRHENELLWCDVPTTRTRAKYCGKLEHPDFNLTFLRLDSVHNMAHLHRLSRIIILGTDPSNYSLPQST